MAQDRKYVTVNATGCGFDPTRKIKYLFKFIFSFIRFCPCLEQGDKLSSATQQAMHPEFGGQ